MLRLIQHRVDCSKGDVRNDKSFYIFPIILAIYAHCNCDVHLGGNPFIPNPTIVKTFNVICFSLVILAIFYWENGGLWIIARFRWMLLMFSVSYSLFVYFILAKLGYIDKYEWFLFGMVEMFVWLRITRLTILSEKRSQ